MAARASHLTVFALLLILLATAPADAATEGDYSFGPVFTCNIPTCGFEGRIYENDGTTLVPTGALAQFIVGRNGAAIVDPLEHFDTEGAPGIDTPGEVAAVLAWVNDGADPSDISGGTNKLMGDGTPTFTGELALVAPGDVYYNWFEDPNYYMGDEGPQVQYGVGHDYIAMRVWNLTKDELENWDGSLDQELWYWTDRELSTYEGMSPPYPPRDNGWCVGDGNIPEGAYPEEYGWSFNGTIGVDVALGYKTKNTLDTRLSLIPEPATTLLIAGAALLLLVRRKN